MKRKWRHWGLCAILAGGSALAAWSLGGVRFFQILNLKAYDAHFVLRSLLSSQPTISNIVLLTADQKTSDTFPEPRLFWQKHYSDAIRAAGQAGAKVIGLDLAFGVAVDQWQPDYDRLLGEAVGTSPAPVVCGYVSELNTSPGAQAIPINMMAAALGLGAFANLTSDADDFVRRQELIEQPGKAGDAPPARSFALRVAEKYMGTDAQFQDGSLTLAGQRIPISSDRAIAINYAGPPGTFPSHSLADFEAAAKAGDWAKLRSWVNGKIVLLGIDFADEDRKATPFYTLFSGPKWTTAGVEIHANTIRTILEHRYLALVPEWVRWFALLLATAVAVWIATSFRAAGAAGFMLLEVAAIIASTHLAFESGFIVSTSEILLATLICLIASVVYRFWTEEKGRNLFQRAISLFVGKQLATSLEETQNIALCGKNMEVTVLFTDIRGFTAFTEEVCAQQGPEEVVRLLNEYMAMMVGIIVMFHGHANKFIGDGILAIFCDEDEGAKPGDHALRAVQCAARIVTASSQFQTGAGIHTGPAVVGNVGSADKMEYTVLGDTVNLASRLESLNKERHTKLLMTGATQSRLSGRVKTEHLGMVPVRGKALPIDLYTVSSLVSAKAVVNA
ncbi:MAG TPA: adenylate/guanylate cyclase domain-containing protein [Bryobacteraceae bacterium]|nr:adenylate/guanylate cyclase domain-containing protein [Bryobacteraceae bacterium]